MNQCQEAATESRAATEQWAAQQEAAGVGDCQQRQRREQQQELVARAVAGAQGGRTYL